MKKVKYLGTFDVIIPSLGLVVTNGDVIEVPDDFSNACYADYDESTLKEEESNNA